jgi:ribosome production factor 2
MSLNSRQPKNQRSRRALESRAPKLTEDTKSSLILRGPNSSALIQNVLRDLHKLKQPFSQMLSKANNTRPFEDFSSIEFLSNQNDKSLFAYGSHSKKRPNNLILGRTFDSQLLTMLELGVDLATYQSIADFDKSGRKATVRYNGKPLFIFQGAAFDSNNNLKLLKSLILDFFRGEELEKINLAALDRIIIITAVDNSSENSLNTEGNDSTNCSVYFRHCGVLLKKSGSKFPRVELEEVGPRMNLTMRRIKQGSTEIINEAMKQPKTHRNKQIQAKNISSNAMGDRVGRVHMQRQNLQNVAISKMKALKAKRKAEEHSETNETNNNTNMDIEQSKNTAARDEFEGSANRRKSGAGGFGPNTSYAKPTNSNNSNGANKKVRKE